MTDIPKHDALLWLVDKTNWVINLFSRSLSDAEIALLKKGLNFAVTPVNIPATEIIAKVETAVRQLDAEQADTVRRAVNGILLRDALKSLKEDESITVLPADKGRASVVMDTATYRAKISTLIENGPYQLLNKDPTDRLTRKLSEKLLTLLPYMGYIGMCGPKGYGFSAVLVINRVSNIAILPPLW